MYLTVESRRVHAATGGRAFDPERPAVVLLHGAGFDRRIWAAQARALAGRGRAVLAPDLPGHGRSSGPARDSVEALADWIAALVDAAGLETAALAGHSLGGLVALEAAARRPERVRALVLFGVAERIPVHSGLLAAAHDDPARARALIARWAFGPDAGAEPRERAAALLAGSRAGALRSDLLACDRYRGGEAAAARVRCPCRLVLGAEDRLVPADGGRVLAGRIPGAATTELAGCGHMMMLEDPERTLDALGALP